MKKEDFPGLLRRHFPLKKNIGSIDRVVLVVLAILFGILFFSGTVTGTFGLVLLVLGGVFLATSLISFCPVYAVVGLSTCPAAERR